MFALLDTVPLSAARRVSRAKVAKRGAVAALVVLSFAAADLARAQGLPAATETTVAIEVSSAINAAGTAAVDGASASVAVTAPGASASVTAEATSAGAVAGASAPTQSTSVEAEAQAAATAGASSVGGGATTEVATTGTTVAARATMAAADTEATVAVGTTTRKAQETVSTGRETDASPSSSSRARVRRASARRDGIPAPARASRAVDRRAASAARTRTVRLSAAEERRAVPGLLVASSLYGLPPISRPAAAVSERAKRSASAAEPDVAGNRESPTSGNGWSVAFAGGVGGSGIDLFGLGAALSLALWLWRRRAGPLVDRPLAPALLSPLERPG